MILLRNTHLIRELSNSIEDQIELNTKKNQKLNYVKFQKLKRSLIIELFPKIFTFVFNDSLFMKKLCGSLISGCKNNKKVQQFLNFLSIGIDIFFVKSSKKKI